MPIVEMPNGDLVDFAEGTPDDEIRSLILRKFPEFGSSPAAEVASNDAGLISDIGTAATKGAVAFNQSLIGIGNLLTSGRAGKAVKDAGYDAEARQKQLDTRYSEETQAANQAVREADGFVDTVGAAVSNPRAVGAAVIESIPQMVGGVGVARGLIGATGKALAPVYAGAAGEGVMAAGSAAESIREGSDDGILTGKQSLAALASGIGTGAFGALGGKIAGSKVGQKLGLADIDTILAQGGPNALLAGQAKQGFIKSVIGSGISEGVLEELPQSMQEQMWQNYALDKPITEGVGNAAAMGMLAGAAMGGVGGGYNALATKPAPKPVVQPEEILAATSTDDAISKFVESVAADNITADELLAGLDESAIPAPSINIPQGAQNGPAIPAQSAVVDTGSAASPSDNAQGSGGNGVLRPEAGAASGGRTGVPGTVIQGAAAGGIAADGSVQPGNVEITQAVASPAADIRLDKSAPQANTQAESSQKLTSEVTSAQPLTGGGGAETSENSNSDKYGKWIENLAKRNQQEEWGQDVLDAMIESNEAPQDVAQKFWGETYQAMPQKGRDLFKRLYKANTGQSLEDSDNPMDMIDLGDNAANLEGTERGFVALMREANLRVGQARIESGISVDGEVISPQLPAIPAKPVKVVQSAAETSPVFGTNAAGKITLRGVPMEQIKAVRDKLGLKGTIIGKDSAVFPKGADLKTLQAAFNVEPAAPSPKQKKSRRASTDLLQRIKQLGGVDAGQALDITGETRAPGGWKFAFRKGGTGLDDLATQLAADGFQIDTSDVDGGVQQLRDMIRSHINGNRNFKAAQQEDAAQTEADSAYAGDLIKRAQELGINWKSLSQQQLDDAIYEAEDAIRMDALAEREAISDEGMAAAGELADMIDDGIDVPFGDEVQTDDAALAAFLGEQDGENDKASGGSAEKTAGEGTQEGAERGTRTEPETQEVLKSYTNAEVLKREAAQAAQERAKRAEEEDARAEQAKKDQAAVDAKIKERTANPDNFQFGESSKQAAAPVGDLFSQPANKSAKSKKLEVLKAQAAGKITGDQGAALKELADAGEHAAVDEVLKPAKPNVEAIDTPPKPVEKSAENVQNEASGKIEDFGEKIAGAKKEYAAAYKDRMAEAKTMDVLAQPLSKSWPEPDYQKLVDSGFDKHIVGLVRSMRDEIPNKPGKSYRQATWAKQVELLRDTADQLLNDKAFADKFVGDMKKVEHLKLDDAINGRAELYALLGHDKSLKGIRISRSQYGVYNGVTHNPPKIIWEVTREAKATAFGNMPRTLGSGDTRQAAIDSFAKAYSTLDTSKENGALTKFELYADRYAKAGDKGQYFIGKKVGRNVMHIKDGFDTVKEARAYMAEHNAELTAILEKKKAIPSERYDTNKPRVGQDMRDGQDVTPQMFQDAFSFRGVQFGNYVEGARRQKDLNDAYDALMDLAAVLDIPPKALSLNGELGLAFGARGSGGVNAASAHYEPGQVVINLTKGAGAGSLAHEWWHSLSNYFSRAAGQNNEHATERLDVSLASRDSAYQFKDDGIRKEMIDAFGAVVKAIKNTGMKERSRSLDSRRSKEYWGTGDEMAARAFERYVIAKLHDSGFANDYLANVVSEEYWNAADALGIGEGGSYPYPTESELPVIRGGFDEFLQAIESKETDKGVALYEPNEAYIAEPGAQAYANPYDSLEIRPNTKPEQLEAGRSALEAVEERVFGRNRANLPEGTTLLGSAISKDFRDKGYTSLVGQEVATSRDLAMVAQVLRDPRFETFRALYVKAGRIVGERAYTSRMAGSVSLPRDIAEHISTDMGRTGAEGYWLLHNHPSGRADASRGDINLTEHINGIAKGMLGHVIIDHNEYNAISMRGGIESRAVQDVIEADLGAMSEYPEVPNKLLGAAISGPADIAAVAKSLQQDGIYSSIIGRSARGEVTMVLDVPKMDAQKGMQKLRYAAMIRRAARETSSDSVFAVVPGKLEDFKHLMDGLFMDVIEAETGRSASEAGMMMGGKSIPATAAQERGGLRYVAEPEFDRLDTTSPQEYGETTNRGRYGQNESDATGAGNRAFSERRAKQDIHRTVGGKPAAEGWISATRAARNGSPIVLYRGSDNALDPSHFALNALGRASGNPSSGLGVWMTTGKGEANTYGATVEEFHLDIRNPKVIRVDNLPGFDSVEEAHSFRENLRKQGHDGIAIDSRHLGKKEVHFVAFDPHQVIYPEFSVDEPKAAYSRSGESAQGKIVGNSGRPYTSKQIAAMQRTGSVITKKSIKDLASKINGDAWKRMAQGLADQFRPVRDIDEHAYTLLRLSKGATGAFEAFMQYGKLSLKDGATDADQSGGVLDTVFFPLGGETTDFLRWIAGNRAERLKKVGREHLFTDEDIEAFKSLSEGQVNFDYTMADGTTTRDRTKIYADSLKKFNGFSKNVLDIAEQSGLIDRGSRALWEHEFYVPFYRVAEEAGKEGEARGMFIKSGVLRQEAFKKLKGGEEQLNDLLANTLMNWMHLIDASAKNRAAVATMEAAEKVGAARKAAPGDTKTSWVMKDGQKVEYKVEDPYIVEALSALEFSGIRGPMMDILSKPKHWLTIGVTASPFFKVRNLIRDSVQAIGTASDSGLSYNPVANVAKGFKLTNRKNPAQEYVSALAGGGLIRFGTMLEGNEASRTRQLIKQGAKDEHILDDEGKIQAFYDKWIEPTISAYNELGNRGEEVNRMALYDQMIKDGASHADAALAARDLMDFSMQGSWGTIRFLSQLVPFMNARIQGMYKLGRAASQDKARFAIVLGATTMASLALLAAYGDDDDWKKREDWDRDNYWWFKIGGIAYRIPKPFEIGAIATLAERTAELLFDDEMNGERFKDVTTSLAANQLAMNPVPQTFKPLIDLYANTDSFTKRPIEPMGLERVDPSQRYTQSTSMVARGVSSAGNAVTGESFLSPVQIDFLVRSYFGWMGATAVSSADMLVRSVSDGPTKPAIDHWKMATGGMVAELSSAQSRYISMMYDQAAELEQAHATYNRLRKEGKKPEAKEYKADNKEKLEKYKRTESVKKKISALNERVRMIERSNKKPDEKKALINQLRARQNEIAKTLFL